MTVKQQVLKMLEQLPDECSVEDVHYQLYLIEKVQRGLKSIDEGKGVPHEQVKKQLATWPTK
jgi:predicted transcriptional regulator